MRSNTSMGFYWWIIIIFCVLGTVFALIGLYMEHRQNQFVDHGLRVNVRVVQMHTSRDSDGDYTYKPEFEIESGVYAGRRHTSSFSTNPPIHAVGDTGPGLYNPETGEIQSGKSARSIGIFAILFSSLGSGILVAALVFWYRARGI